jgi:protocatechuate 3,4-dioxygenase beta subunit
MDRRHWPGSKLDPRMIRSRRSFFRLLGPLMGGFGVVACGQRVRSGLPQGSPPPARAQTLPPTPACGNGEPTPAQTAGPFFTPNSPQRNSLIEPGMAGSPMVLTGQVLSTNCVPVANALVDFWHTNDAGEYDNRGYSLRGHQYTDAEGRYRLETIVPGIYPGRTRHFHVKAQAANQPVLTTQLYFPGEALNEQDFLFQPELLMAVNNTGGKQAAFNFVLNA